MKSKSFFKVLNSVFIFIAFPFFIACSSNDDDNNIEVGLYAITIAELESQPSFVYVYESTLTNTKTYTHLWFRNGVMTISEDGYNTKYNYSIKDRKLILERDKSTYHGNISKSVQHKKTQLAITNGRDGENLPKNVLHWYDYSSVDMSKY